MCEPTDGLLVASLEPGSSPARSTCCGKRGAVRVDIGGSCEYEQRGESCVWYMLMQLHSPLSPFMRESNDGGEEYLF